MQPRNKCDRRKKRDETDVVGYEYDYLTSGDKTSTQLDKLTITKGSSSGEYKEFNYTYDANGNITSINDGTNVITYYYDDLNQLVRAEDGGAKKVWTYSYDAGGNIQNKTEYSIDEASNTNVLVSSTDYTYSTSDWGDLLEGITTDDIINNTTTSTTITSDLIGNMTDDGTWEYTWQHGRQLASMANGSTTVSFEYDASGMRTEKTVGNKTWQYVYNGSTLSYMTDGTNELYFSYDSAGPLSVSYNGTEYYYVLNAQGDIIALVNSSGSEVVTYTYGPWGELLSVDGSMKNTLGQMNPLRYRGYVYDTETGLYYLQSRYYNPELCRFICADGMVSTGQDILGFNMFAYCLNNPVNRYDPSGNSSIRRLVSRAKRALRAKVNVAKAISRIKASQEDNKIVLHNPDSLLKSENDQVKVTLTYFPPDLVDHIGVSGGGWLATAVGAASSGATRIMEAKNVCTNLIPYIDIISCASSIYGIADICVDLIYVESVEQEAKDNHVGVVLVEEEWTVYDGQYWEFKKSYYVFWDGEYGTNGHKDHPF